MNDQIITYALMNNAVQAENKGENITPSGRTDCQLSFPFKNTIDEMTGK
jgi:hypothetical protein